jgi:hypothetical protein
MYGAGVQFFIGRRWGSDLGFEQGQSAHAEGANLDEIAAGNAVAEAA